MKVRVLLLIACLGNVPAAPQAGTPRAVMSSPSIGHSSTRLSLRCHISNLLSGAYYRLGVGTDGERIEGLEIRLMRGDEALSRKRVVFRQEFAREWYQLDSLLVEGFSLVRADVPPRGEPLTLEASLPLQEAHRLGRLFLVVARRYSLRLWYLEDGAELTPSDW